MYTVKYRTCRLLRPIYIVVLVVDNQVDPFTIVKTPSSLVETPYKSPESKLSSNLPPRQAVASSSDDHSEEPLTAQGTLSRASWAKPNPRQTKRSQAAGQEPPLGSQPKQKQPTATELGRASSATSTRQRREAQQELRSAQNLSSGLVQSPENTLRDSILEVENPQDVDLSTENQPDLEPQSVYTETPSLYTNPVIINQMSTSGTSAAPIANGASGFKVPNPWDKNSPSFDGQTADSLLKYFRHCEMIIEGANINDDKGKKAVLMKYVDRPVQEIWEGLATFASDTFVKWSKEVRSLYPEIKELENGSLERIKEISAAARNLGRHQQGLIKRFGLTFGIEAKKISKPPCLLTNKQLVDLYLTSFEHDFRREIEMMIRQTQYYRDAAGPIQGPATRAGVNPNGTNTGDVERPEDTIPLQELFDMVNSMAKTYSGVTPVEVKLNGEARSISKDKIPPLSFDSTGGNQLVKIKTEIDERFDIFSNDIAQLKDGHKTQQKHIDSGFERLEKTVRQVMSQASRGPAPHQELNTTIDSGNKDQDRSLKGGLFDRPYKSNEDRACFYCLITGHMVRDCPYKQEHIDAGQLIIEDNRMKMGDGTPLPSWPQDKSKKQRVDDYYVGKTIPGAPHVSMRAYTPPKPSVAQFHAQIEDVESLYSLYDTRDDEIRSHRVQKQIAKNSGKTDNYQPTFLALQQQSHNTATYTPNNQGISYSINQASAVPIAGAPAGMDISQLVALVDLIRGQGLPTTQDQFAVTRQSANKDGSSPPNF
ncbi:hypothetical protein FB451DRAFT_1363225 [Mycena latifolia]|nr:hypothetical protein FB451DRAFT_1363225 [Mycena latifolia]